MADDQQKPKRLLVRGVNWLGDAVMSTAALIRLRQALPAAHITLLSIGKLADLWKGHSGVDEVIPFEKTDGVQSVARQLREGQFDTALVFPNSLRSALEVCLGGIPRRIGYAGPARSLFLNQIVRRRANEVPMRKRSEREVKRLIRDPNRERETYPFSAHHLHNYLHLAGALGASVEPVAPKIHVGPAEVAATRQKWNLPERQRYLGINHGAEYGPAKRWPPERFIEAALQISRRIDCRWIIFGGKGDIKTAADISMSLAQNLGSDRITNLAGQTTLRELCAALSVCEALLTNDTGPMHLAAAVGARVVVPFGSTSPELTSPGLPGDLRHAVIPGHAQCAPCFRRQCPIDFRCMLSITAERLAERLLHVQGQASLSRSVPD